MKATPELRQWFAEQQAATASRSEAWMAEHCPPVDGHHPDCDGWMPGPHVITADPTSWGGWTAECACGWAMTGATGRMERHRAEQLASDQHRWATAATFEEARCDRRCLAW